MPSILRDHPRARLLIAGRDRAKQLSSSAFKSSSSTTLFSSCARARRPTSRCISAPATCSCWCPPMKVFRICCWKRCNWGFPSSHLAAGATLSLSETPTADSWCRQIHERWKPPSESFSPIRRCEHASAQEANDAWKILRGRRWSRVRHNFFKTSGTTHGSLRRSFR